MLLFYWLNFYENHFQILWKIQSLNHSYLRRNYWWKFLPSELVFTHLFWSPRGIEKIVVLKNTEFLLPSWVRKERRIEIFKWKSHIGTAIITLLCVVKHGNRYEQLLYSHQCSHCVSRHSQMSQQISQCLPFKNILLITSVLGKVWLHLILLISWLYRIILRHVTFLPTELRQHDTILFFL